MRNMPGDIQNRGPTNDTAMQACIPLEMRQEMAQH